jgi:hypothetical protein
VAKAEHIDGKENPRFVVTSLAANDWDGRRLYEELYCARGDMENRIKEQFSLFADRVSTETIRANQMRLYLSAMAYILVSGLRRLGLKATELAEAQVSTIRTKLLKIGAQIRVTARKVWVSMASSYPSTRRSGRTCAAETPTASSRSPIWHSAALPGSDQCACTGLQQPHILTPTSEWPPLHGQIDHDFRDFPKTAPPALSSTRIRWPLTASPRAVR